MAKWKIVGWFSCGNNSAVMSKLLALSYPEDELRICRCVVANEHPDNDRFHADVEAWIGRPIERLASEQFADCWEVWEQRKYMAGIKGAPCTTEMKKVVRWRLEQDWQPDLQAFGFSADEEKRATRFQQLNPDVQLVCPLLDAGVTKLRCAELVVAAGLALPAMYGMGFSNNNCRCCVKATSPIYWARCRHYFPAEFARTAELSRRLGARLCRLAGKRIFVDELPADFDWQRKDRTAPVECGVLCLGEA